MSDLHHLDAVSVLAALDRGDTTSAELCAELLRICAENSHLGAFNYLEPDEVMSAAVAADNRRRRGERAALLGLPLAIKDNINSAGIPTTAGTPLLRDHRPVENAPVLQRLLDKGAIMLGKTAMHELAFGISGNNNDRTPARNPVDPGRIPGGSSSGTAIAVAAGMAPAGLGSDTGGSVRIPAALCGIVALRPTTGRYPGKGVVPISSTRDTVGSMARTVADVALMDAAITGAADPLPDTPIETVRLGVPNAFFFDDVDAEVAALTASAIERLRSAGATIVDVPGADLGRLYSAAGFPITLYEAIPTMESYLRENGLPYTFADIAANAANDDVAAILRDLQGPGAISDEVYDQAMTVYRPALQSVYGDLFAANRLDAIVFPATPTPAVPIGVDTMEVNGRTISLFEIFIRNSGPGSVSGVPGLVLPCERTSLGLPVGISLDGPAFSDRHLLAVGATIAAVVAG